MFSFSYPKNSDQFFCALFPQALEKKSPFYISSDIKNESQFRYKNDWHIVFNLFMCQRALTVSRMRRINA